jgi:hypothetical protein
MARGDSVDRHVTTLSMIFGIVSVAYGIHFAYASTFSSRIDPGSRSYEPDRWLMKTDHFSSNHYQSNPYVANGYFGQSLPAEGVGYWIQMNTSLGYDAYSVNGMLLLRHCNSTRS